MTPGHAIATGSDELERAARGTTHAAQAFAAASPQLRTAIPLDAFGTFGQGIAMAGNGLGGAIASVITLLGKVSAATSDGLSSARLEFERVENEAEAHFRGIENGFFG